jgi:vitamin B12 transporter
MRFVPVTGRLRSAPAILTIAALAPLDGALAQEPPVTRGSETVVTAGRIVQPLADTLRPVVVIHARDIEQSGQLTLPEVLQQFGGVEIASNGGAGGAASVFMRGANSAHTLVLVDGIRLGSATTGTTAFENIPLAQIERIEIVSGPASSLYGSDAIGGVIQIFTKSGRYSPGATVQAGIGGDATRSLRASASGTAGGTELTVSAGYLATDGFSAGRPTLPFGGYNPDDDPYRNSSFSAKVAHRPDPRHELGASVMHSRGTAHFDSGPGTDDRTEQSLTSAAVHSRNQFTAGWESLLRVGTGRDDSESLETAFPGRFTTRQNQASWQNTLRLGDHSAIAGIEYLAQEVEASTPYDVTRRTVRSAFAGFTGNWGDHALQADVRRDDNSQFGTPGTGSVAYGYRVSPDLRLRAAWGKAFHAPSFNDLYYPGFGNPALAPERSRSGEAGLEWSAAGQRFVATAFDNRISDLIVFVFDPADYSYLPQNIAEARIKGLEMSWEGRLLDSRIRARATWQDPKSRDGGYQLQRRAKQFGSVTASRAFDGWTAGVEVVGSGARYDSSDESADSRMAGYAVANLTLSRALADGWRLEARWNNVFDRDYELAKGYATPGSNLFVAVSWTPSR